MPTDWDERFQAMIPLLLGVLRRLQEQGYVTRHEQSFDLLHDFYLDVWPTLVHRFDPSRGTADSYVAGAFGRYARRWLAREARWFYTLTDVPEPSSAEVHTPDATVELDLPRIREATGTLGVSERRLLLERFGNDPRSEREIARRHGLSRYTLRKRLAEALARISAAIDAKKEAESSLPYALFVRGLSDREAAEHFSTTEARVRMIRRNLLKAFGEAAGGAL